MCDFFDLLQQYANTLPSRKLMFRVSKPCGYSQLIMLPRMPNSNQINVSDLLIAIQEQMGDYTAGKIYYYPKGSTPSATITPIFLNHFTSFGQPLAEFALSHLPIAYAIEDCKYAVYQLFIDIHCDHAGCCCNSQPTFPPTPQGLSLAHPEEDTMWIENEPSREELLSLLYDDVPPPPPCSPSPTPSPSPAPFCSQSHDSQTQFAAQPIPSSPALTSRSSSSSSSSGLVTPWG
jgi:hypothetical protein